MNRISINIFQQDPQNQNSQIPPSQLHLLIADRPHVAGGNAVSPVDPSKEKLEQGVTKGHSMHLRNASISSDVDRGETQNYGLRLLKGMVGLPITAVLTQRCCSHLGFHREPLGIQKLKTRSLSPEHLLKHWPRIRIKSSRHLKIARQLYSLTRKLSLLALTRHADRREVLMVAEKTTISTDLIRLAVE